MAVLNSIWSQYPTTGATIMRTDVVRDAGGYGEIDGAEDWALGAGLLFRGPVGWSERPGRHYRQHGASTWNRHSTTRHLIGHARTVRGRLRQDAAVPSWYRRSLPLILLGQHAAILAVRPLSHLIRRLGRTA